MKNVFLLLMACIIGVGAYANTCVYGNVKVTLHTERITTNGVYGNVKLDFSTDCPTKYQPVQIVIYDSKGEIAFDDFIALQYFDASKRKCSCYLTLPEGHYTARLVQPSYPAYQPGHNTCYYDNVKVTLLTERITTVGGYGNVKLRFSTDRPAKYLNVHIIVYDSDREIVFDDIISLSHFDASKRKCDYYLTLPEGHYVARLVKPSYR